LVEDENAGEHFEYGVTGRGKGGRRNGCPGRREGLNWGSCRRSSQDKLGPKVGKLVSLVQNISTKQIPSIKSIIHQITAKSHNVISKYLHEL
jgi:hypothetical protein